MFLWSKPRGFKRIRISDHAAELLEVYADALEMELGAHLTVEQAAERVIRLMLDKNLERLIEIRANTLKPSDETKR